MLLHAGRVRFPWLANGRSVTLPPLTLGELLDAKGRDLARLERLGLTDETPAWKRKELVEIADTAFVADCLQVRFQKADASITMERLEAILTSPALVLAAADVVARADAATFPRSLIPFGPGIEAFGRPASATTARTATSSLRRARTWLRARFTRGSPS